MTTGKRVLLGALAALLLAGCHNADGSGHETTAVAESDDSLGRATADTRWVVEGVAYAGPRGGPGRHYVMCVPDGVLGSDPRTPGRGLWKEVDIPSDDGSLDRGDPCPSGGTIYDDGPVRLDSGS